MRGAASPSPPPRLQARPSRRRSCRRVFHPQKANGKPVGIPLSWRDLQTSRSPDRWPVKKDPPPVARLDRYAHLDYPTIVKLAALDVPFFLPLGSGAPRSLSGCSENVPVVVPAP